MNLKQYLAYYKKEYPKIMQNYDKGLLPLMRLNCNEKELIKSVLIRKKTESEIDQKANLKLLKTSHIGSPKFLQGIKKDRQLTEEIEKIKSAYYQIESSECD